MRAPGKRTVAMAPRLLRASPFALAARLLDLGAPHRRVLERFAQRGTITILFTDIADFTSTTEKGGERAALALLDAHDGIVVPAVRRNRGRVVKSLGDGIMAAFSDPGDAVAAAATILEQTAARNGRRRPLRMRVGLDTGKPTKRGGDYIGHTVNVAARLVKRARPGEALATEAVRRGAGKTDGVATWHEAGRPALKGLREPPRTWRLRPAPRKRTARTAERTPRRPGKRRARA